MRKNIFSQLFMLSLFIGILSGCNMNLYPEDELSTATYFTSETELKEYSNYFYRMMPDPETMYAEEGEHFISPIPSDLVVGIRDIHSGEAWWKKDNWKNLRKINYLLVNAHQCEDIAARDHYRGVAYFFRAYFYFDMLRHFGAVPWYDAPLNAEDKEQLNKPRDSRDVVFNHIVEDLDSAFALLPKTRTAYEVNAYTALALKSRACLFEGTFRKYHAGSTFNGGSSVYNEQLPWEEILTMAANCSYELMNSGYKLYTSGEEPYRDLFATLTPQESEVIWARAFSNDLNIKHNAQAWSVARTTSFTKRHADLYLMKDGTRFNQVQGYDTLGYLKVFENRDPCMAQTIHAPGYIQKGATKTYAVNMSMTTTGYKYIKYIMESAYNNWGGSVCSMPIFRLAEVYLNYAEAKAELGTLTQADLDKSINVLRDRVGMPHLDMATANANPCAYMEKCYPNVSQSANKGVIMEIRRERLIETPLEGLHYWDIMRWREGKAFTQPYLGIYFPGPGKYDMTGSGKASINLMEEGQTGGGGIGVTKLYLGSDVILTNGTLGNMWAFSTLNFQFDENKDYLYPIPTNERVLTNGALTQNPGWNDGLSF